MKVIVSCSGKFHAFALAEQLQNENHLLKLFTAYSSIKTPWLVKLAKRVDKEAIPKQKIKSNIIIAVGLKLYNNPHFWNNLFDRWVAFNLQFTKADVFIGWSGMSLHSIKVAKKRGMLTIVERGSSHIEYQNEILKTEYQKFGKSFAIDKKVIKKELLEYEVADFISIPSGFVKNSFIEKGVNEEKLVLNNYGASNYFKFDNSIPQKNNKFKILYLGTLNIRKGLIYLFEALNTLSLTNDQFEVYFIGSIDDEIKETINKFKKENWHFLGHINHYELAKHISIMDVAIHPSIEEGLSMVITQILSCGVPVIATTNTGGADIIEDGINGFIVTIRDANAIALKIEAVFNKKLPFQNSKDIDFTWDNYGKRYIQSLSQKINASK
jgi:glycosyltransferase involved in cell wall biosynthesis